MERETRGDLKISGAGSTAGGIYNMVEINGAAKINGDFDCIDYEVNGVAKASGNVKTKTGKINGKAEIKGNLAAEEFRINGRAEIDGNLDVKEIKIMGSADIKGNLSAEEVKIEGSAEVKGDIEAEAFISKGAFTVGGLLNAGNIDIHLYGNCQAREIGGEKINVKKNDKIRVFGFQIFPFSAGLSTETIEGDDIYLEYTKAKVVRGNNIILGPGCNIGLVEYKNNFQKDSASEVKDHKKLTGE